MTSLRIRRIERAKDFVALAPLWDKLAQESGETSPFLSYDWFWCCWHAVWPRRRPEVLLIEEAGSPVAIIPLMCWRERLHGLPVRCLGLLECPTTPMVDILTLSEHGRVIKAFLDHLASRSDWDMVCLERLPATSPTLKALEDTLPGRLPWRRVGNLLSPYLAIGGEWTSFYGTRSQRLKQTYQHLEDELERAGELRVEEYHAVDPQSPLFVEAMEVTRRSWKADGGGATQTMPRMTEFLSELTRRATKNGWLSLWLLRLNGQAIAMEYQLRTDGKVHALHTDDDPAYRELSPGTILSFAIIRSLFERGCIQEYDMGPCLNADKLQWATGSQERVHLKLYRPALYSRLLHRVETAGVQGVWKWRELAGSRCPLPSSSPGADDAAERENRD